MLHHGTPTYSEAVYLEHHTLPRSIMPNFCRLNIIISHFGHVAACTRWVLILFFSLTDRSSVPVSFLAHSRLFFLHQLSKYCFCHSTPWPLIRPTEEQFRTRDVNMISMSRSHFYRETHINSETTVKTNITST